ncbi:MAG: type II secretion system protein [Candidatus Paceibacterota bacterium]|jgi:prepilin-type N-terminal cleavage/methylation domain-containing protein
MKNFLIKNNISRSSGFARIADFGIVRSVRAKPMPKFTTGFTLIETMVAIAVLLIAVASPLVVSQRSISSAMSSKEQMVAFYLAQDAMEQVRAIRDNNGLNNATNWFSAPESSELETLLSCTDVSPCTIDINDGVKRYEDSSLVPPLNFDSEKNIYNYEIPGTLNAVSQYTRVFYLSPTNSKEVLATVKVSWVTNGVSHSVESKSRLFDIR